MKHSGRARIVMEGCLVMSGTKSEVEAFAPHLVTALRIMAHRYQIDSMMLPVLEYQVQDERGCAWYESDRKSGVSPRSFNDVPRGKLTPETLAMLDEPVPAIHVK